MVWHGEIFLLSSLLSVYFSPRGEGYQKKQGKGEESIYKGEKSKIY
jgi:hypothetical protein